MEQEEWFALSRTLSPGIRARDEAARKLQEILDCDSCQTPDGYVPCGGHEEKSC